MRHTNKLQGFYDHPSETEEGKEGGKEKKTAGPC